MCDGGYDGGCNDPDYYDIQFREQNPEVYGNDEVMQEYNGSNASVHRRKRVSSQQNDNTRSEKDEQFHQEYLRWKRNHLDKVQSFREKPKPKQPSDDPSKIVEWPNIVLVLILASIVSFLLIKCYG